MEYICNYGKEFLSLEIPEENIIKFNYRQNNHSEKAEEEIISQAILNPIAAKPLHKAANKKKEACVLVSDITRPCPSYKFLPHLIKELEKAEVEKIKIVFGLGIHRKHTRDEQIRLAGNYAAEKCVLIDSDQNRCISVGTTSRGTPVEVFEEVLDSDFLIATGNIEYHYFAGYSGGSKALMPGVCSYSSVAANHSMMLDEMAGAGQYYDNPVRQDIEEVGKIVNIDYIYNVILDDHKKIIGAVAGKNNEAFIEGMKIYDSFYEITSSEKADIVITACGGYPKDINLYQAQKALDNVKDIIKDKGTIIMIAECPEGFGEDKFAEWMHNASDFEYLYKKIKEKFVLGGHKAVAVSKLLTKAKVLLYSSFDTATTNQIGFGKINSIQDYINSRLSEDKDLRFAVVPNGRFIRFSG